MQTAPGFVAPPVNSALPPLAAQKPPTVSKPKMNLWKPILIGVVLLLVIGAGAGGYFMGIKNQPQKTSAPLTQTVAANLPAVYLKAQEFIASGGSLVTKSDFQITLAGKLVAFEPDKSWTLEKEKERVTVAKGGKESIGYSTSGGVFGAIFATDLQLGDEVQIVASVNQKSGVVAILSVIDIRPIPVQASGSAFPVPRGR